MLQIDIDDFVERLAKFRRTFLAVSALAILGWICAIYPLLVVGAAVMRAQEDESNAEAWSK
jgi:hypothetical protein